MAKDFKPGICKGKESNLVDLEVVPHCPVDCQKDHQGIQPTGYVEKEMERQRIILINCISIEKSEHQSQREAHNTCTELNLEVIKPSVILGTNSSSKLGASPFK